MGSNQMVVEICNKLSERLQRLRVREMKRMNAYIHAIESWGEMLTAHKRELADTVWVELATQSHDGAHHGCGGHHGALMIRYSALMMMSMRNPSETWDSCLAFSLSLARAIAKWATGVNAPKRYSFLVQWSPIYGIGRPAVGTGSGFAYTPYGWAGIVFRIG